MSRRSKRQDGPGKPSESPITNGHGCDVQEWKLESSRPDGGPRKESSGRTGDNILLQVSCDLRVMSYVSGSPANPCQSVSYRIDRLLGFSSSITRIANFARMCKVLVAL
jgi:hypothetical protein